MPAKQRAFREFPGQPRADCADPHWLPCAGWRLSDKASRSYLLGSGSDFRFRFGPVSP